MDEAFHINLYALLIMLSGAAVLGSLLHGFVATRRRTRRNTLDWHWHRTRRALRGTARNWRRNPR